jgi:hypothetical protein
MEKKEKRGQEITPIAIGADDAAVELKAQMVKHLESKGIPVHDPGVFSDALCFTRTLLLRWRRLSLTANMNAEF